MCLYVKVDLILISHFHLDHAASLPYFTEKVGGGSFKGRIFATHPTKVRPTGTITHLNFLNFVHGMVLSQG